MLYDSTRPLASARPIINSVHWPRNHVSERIDRYHPGCPIGLCPRAIRTDPGRHSPRETPPYAPSSYRSLQPAWMSSLAATPRTSSTGEDH